MPTQTFRASSAVSHLPGGTLGMSYQVVLAMLGVQHGSHLLEVVAETALLATGGETQRDDPLSYVDQVHLIGFLHGLHHTLAPAEGRVYRVTQITKAFNIYIYIVLYIYCLNMQTNAALNLLCIACGFV